jgi:hypothetical protein
MGREARCIVRYGGEASEGRALLETDELVFRGDFRLRVPLREIRSARADDGRLEVVFGEDTASFELGPQAERWAQAITHPKTLADKLGVKPGLRIGVVGIEEPDFAGYGPPEAGSDLILVRVETTDDLAEIERLRGLLAPAGRLWVVAPKGRQHLTENDVLRAGREAGLTDVKVARFSATHTAHKFVIPRASR